MSSQAGVISQTAAVDVAALLAPIPGDNPAGQNLRFVSLPGGNDRLPFYDEVREARRADDVSARGVWEKRDRKTADWKLVLELTTEALATATKDIQVCAWLCEALVRLKGFTGLRDGLKVMRGLHEQYWDGLYPEMSGGNPRPRVNVLASLDKVVSVTVQEVPIAHTSDGGVYSYFQWKDSGEFDIPEETAALDQRRLDEIAKVKALAATQNKITSEDWRKAAKATGFDFYEKTCALLGECREEFSALTKVVDEKYGAHAPSMGGLDVALDDIHTLVEGIVIERRPAPPPEPEPVSTDTSGEVPREEPVAVGTTPAAVAGPIRSRQDALNRLAEAAEYFRRHEPHSPISYLVQRAINWSKMPLETWLEEVIKDGGVLGGLRETLGLKPGGGQGADEG